MLLAIVTRDLYFCWRSIAEVNIVGYAHLQMSRLLLPIDYRGLGGCLRSLTEVYAVFGDR